MRNSISKDKRAAMEMSVGTLVTIVLLMAVLILGMIFIRNIMCSGIILTDQVSESVENEVRNLFSADDYGVKCMGERGQEIKLGDGGSRQIICVINTDAQVNYRLTVKSIESLGGISTSNVQNWISDKDWTGNVAPGEKTVTVAVLEIPKRVSNTNLKFEIEEENLDTGTTDTHISYINVAHVSGINSAIC